MDDALHCIVLYVSYIIYLIYFFFESILKRSTTTGTYFYRFDLLFVCKYFCRYMDTTTEGRLFIQYSQNSQSSRTRNDWRILRVLLDAVPTCNRSLINHNRRIWQIKRIRSCRNIFHGDHQIHLSQLLETQHFTAKMSPFWSYWHLCKANSVCGAITSCKIQF